MSADAALGNQARISGHARPPAEPVVQAAEERLLSILPADRVEQFKENLRLISEHRDELIASAE